MAKSLRIRVLEKIGPLIQSIRHSRLKLLGYVNISEGVIIERDVVLDRVYPEEIHIGKGSLIASSATILCHEHVKREENAFSLPLKARVTIGKRCFIGVSSIILPGVTVGDDCVVGAGAVVTKNIPAGSIAVGNPARVLNVKIKMNANAVIIGKSKS